MLEQTRLSHSSETPSGLQAKRVTESVSPMSDLPDLLLVERTRGRDTRAFETLLRYIGPVTAHAKFLERILRGTSDKNIEFDTLCDLLKRFGLSLPEIVIQFGDSIHAHQRAVLHFPIVDGKFCSMEAAKRGGRTAIGLSAGFAGASAPGFVVSSR
jgi:hypothetical protein